MGFIEMRSPTCAVPQNYKAGDSGGGGGGFVKIKDS